MKEFLQFLASSSSSDSLANSFRKKRFQYFCELVFSCGQNPITILDVGGTERFWEVHGFVETGHKIILLNLTAPKSNYPNILTISGDAIDLSMFADQSIDIVFSNSVIEHLFTFENQNKMANEIRRVGKKYYIQTPSYYFPLEPHFLFPFFHWLPKSVRIFLIRQFSLGWYDRQKSKEKASKLVEEIRLLKKSEFQFFFPDAKIISERFFGITKSYIAIKKDY